MEVLLRRRCGDNARDAISHVETLDMFLPPSPNPLFPADDPLGKRARPASSLKMADVEVQPRGPGVADYRDWAGVIVRWNLRS